MIRIAPYEAVDSHDGCRLDAARLESLDSVLKDLNTSVVWTALSRDLAQS
jgi:hypothetical protein